MGRGAPKRGAAAGLCLEGVPCGFCAVLMGVQAVIISAQRQQLVVGAGLGDAPAADDKDLVRAADGGQAVRHDEAGAPCQHRLDGVLDELFRLGVDAAGSLVQNEDARVGEDHAGEAHKLLLPCGKAAAPSPTSVP